MQIEEYERLVSSTQSFRTKYAYKMQETINTLENSMRINVQNINQSIMDYANTAIQYNGDIAKTLEHLQLDIKKLQLQDQFEAHLLNLPSFDPSKVSSFANDWVIKTGIPPPKTPITAKPLAGLTDPNDLFFSIE